MTDHEAEHLASVESLLFKSMTDAEADSAAFRVMADSLMRLAVDLPAIGVHARTFLELVENQERNQDHIRRRWYGLQGAGDLLAGLRALREAKEATRH